MSSSQQQQTSSVYIQVMEDVINKVRDEFVVNGGPGETALNELQALWEAKMIKKGSILGGIGRPSSVSWPSAPLQDLNVAYQVVEEYEIPTTELLFPPTPVHTPFRGSGQAPVPGTFDGSAFDISTALIPFTPGEHTTHNAGGYGPTTGLPGQFRQPPAPWLMQTQKPPLYVNAGYDANQEPVNVGAFKQPTTQDSLTMSTGKRKREEFPSQYHNGYIPQQDGAGDTDELKDGEGSLIADQKSAQGFSSWIPKVDGPVPNQYDDALFTPTIFNYQEVVIEDYNIATPARNDCQKVVNEDCNLVTPAPNDLQAGTPAIVTQNDVAPDEDDEVLNENDDDELDDLDKEEDNKNSHLVLAQFDKVSRTKNRWRCTLKDGILHKANSDVLFNKASGEFNF